MIILNERAYAEECIAKRTLGDKPSYTLSVLAKYYYDKKYKRAEVIRMLTEFMHKYYPKYDCNKAMWDENIEKIAKSSEKHDLITIDGVWITSAELETIGNIHNRVLEKLAFTLLCIV